MPSHKDIKVQIYVERNPLEEYKTSITSNNGDVVESWIASEEGKVSCPLRLTFRRHFA